MFLLHKAPNHRSSDRPRKLHDSSLTRGFIFYLLLKLYCIYSAWREIRGNTVEKIKRGICMNEVKKAIIHVTNEYLLGKTRQTLTLNNKFYLENIVTTLQLLNHKL